MSAQPAAAATHRGIPYQAGLLGAVALAGALLLSLADLATRGPIAERQAEDLKASLSQVVPERLHDNDLLADKLVLSEPDGTATDFYRASRARQITAVAFRVTGQGYSGDIDVVLGLDPQGRILGARVLAHKETPGLGDKIETAKDDWILGFDGLSLGNPPAARWAVKKDGGDFDQFSGATITPRAVVRAIKGGLERFAAHRDALLTPPVTMERLETPN